MLRFETLDVYKDSLNYANDLFSVTKAWPKEYLYDLTSQIRRAGLSTPLNIAEGSSRPTNDFKRFLDIARGSCYECIPLMEVAFKQDLVDQVNRDEWYKRLDRLAKQISALKNSL